MHLFFFSNRHQLLSNFVEAYDDNELQMAVMIERLFLSILVVWEILKKRVWQGFSSSQRSLKMAYILFILIFVIVVHLIMISE